MSPRMALLGLVGAVLVGVFAAFVIGGGSHVRRRDPTRMVAPVAPAPALSTTADHSPGGAILKNRVFVGEMVAGQAIWPVGFHLTSYTPTLARFDNLEILKINGSEQWQVVHLLYRWEATRWVEVANIPPTVVEGDVTNGLLESYQSFVA